MSTEYNFPHQLPEYTRSWIELSTSAFFKNVQTILEATQKSTLTLCLNSNAYGHGLLQMAQLAENDPRISALCLSSPEDSTSLRDAGIKKEIIIHVQGSNCTGTACYGFSTSCGTNDLPTILAWKSRLLRCKHLPTGTSVGYARTFITRRPTTLGILPIGYADGLGRILSNNYWVTIKSTKVPVVGLISMNLTALDITDMSEAQPHDEVIVADKGTPLEFISRLHPHILRLIAP
jgi:alanine racemase